jgi:quercetin dioxygenase-like cupin family protein
VPRGTARLQQASLHNSVWYLDRLITFRALGEETEGRCALLRVQGVQGAEEPHAHAAEDESLDVLAGELAVLAGGAELPAHPGDAVRIPRGVEHAIWHAAATVTYLVHVSPAGFER